MIYRKSLPDAIVGIRSSINESFVSKILEIYYKIIENLQRELFTAPEQVDSQSWVPIVGFFYEQP